MPLYAPGIMTVPEAKRERRRVQFCLNIKSNVNLIMIKAEDFVSEEEELELKPKKGDQRLRQLMRSNKEFAGRAGN